VVAALIALALAAPAPTHDVLPIFLGDRGPVYLDFGQRSTLASSLRVFRAPRTLDDLLPRGLFTRAYEWNLDSGSARLLAPGLYGIREPSGAVCFWPVRGWGYCVAGLRHGAYPFVDARNGTVYGLLGDGAARITVDGRAAKIGRNGFYVRARRVRRVVVTDRDGAVHVYTFEPCEVVDYNDNPLGGLAPLDPKPDYCY
jgi:hypothetical protein